MKHQDISEIWAGLLITGKVPAEYILPEYLAPPYDLICTHLRDEKEITYIIDKVGMMPVVSAKTAVATIGDSIDIPELLSQLLTSYKREQQLAMLENQVRRLKKGEDIDVAKMVTLIDKSSNYTGQYQRLDDIADNPTIWRPTFYPPIDEHCGDPENYAMSGVPESGLVVIGGPPGTGKTSLIAKIIAGCAANGKVSLLYTLEMTTGQIAKRILQVAMKPLTQEQKHNVIISDRIMSVDEVYSDAMRLAATEHVYAIFIDFSDMLVEGNEDEQSMAYVYRRCASLAKENTSGAPVFLLAQLNRNYTGGIPKINHLRYSGMAEAVAALIFLIYNPNQIYATTIKDNALPVIPGTGYIINGKSRFGYREGGPGAIRVEFDGKMAWGTESQGWNSLDSV